MNDSKPSGCFGVLVYVTAIYVAAEIMVSVKLIERHLASIAEVSQVAAAVEYYQGGGR